MEDGDYEIHGIVPGADYTVEIVKISQVFTGGSSIEPCDPPASGFDDQVLSGTFRCSQGGEVILVGSTVTTDIVTTKNSQTTGADDNDSSGGCQLVAGQPGTSVAWAFWVLLIMMWVGLRRIRP